MARRQLKSIPKPSHEVPAVLRRILEPIIDAIETRFLGRENEERVVTRGELVDLGLVTQEDLNNLDN